MMRLLRRLIADKLVERDNAGMYRITPLGRSWAQAGEALIDWLEDHRHLLDDDRGA
jgi:DNA-binding HxlR family transcriptional regulator